MIEQSESARGPVVEVAPGSSGGIAAVLRVAVPFSTIALHAGRYEEPETLRVGVDGVTITAASASTNNGDSESCVIVGGAHGAPLLHIDAAECCLFNLCLDAPAAPLEDAQGASGHLA